MNATHVIIENYVATFVDDISVVFADTLSIISENNEESVLVEVVRDCRRGFVPRSIVRKIGHFQQQLV